MTKTDLETIQEIYTKAKIIYNVNTIPNGCNNAGCWVLSTQAQGGPNNHGYTGFVSSLTFTKEGELMYIGVWE